MMRLVGLNFRGLAATAPLLRFVIAGLLLQVRVGALQHSLDAPAVLAADAHPGHLREAGTKSEAASSHRSIILQVLQPFRAASANWTSGSLLVLVSCFGMLSLRAGRPPASKDWTPQQHSWLVASVLQLSLIAGTSSFLFVGFPSHAARAGLEPWQIGAALGALPLGHALALPLYPAVSRVLPASVICSAAALCRAALISALAFPQHAGILIACRLAWGASCGLAQSAAMSFLQLHWPRPEELNGFLESEDRIVSLGAMLGCSVGAPLLLYNYAAPFWMAAVLNLVLAAFTLVAFRRPQEGLSKGAAYFEVPDCFLRCKAPARAKDGAEPAALVLPLHDGDAGKGSAAPPACTTGAALWAWCGILAASASLSLASAATTFWEPVLSPYLQRLSPDLFASPLDVGIAWTAFFATQTLLGPPANHLSSFALRLPLLCGPNAVISGPWLVSGAGWLTLATGTLFLAATSSAAPISLAAGLLLVLTGTALVSGPSMGCLLVAGRPLGRSAAEQVLPEVWLAASCIGEAAGPLLAALAVSSAAPWHPGAAGADVSAGAVGLASPAGVRGAAWIGSLVAFGIVAVLTASMLGRTLLQGARQLSSSWRL
mmetsp:Transcript_83434/g.239657  ORF Transcript_83434/g.239657 Transcript_83434/m.239657 type:complete len:602 (+) Transcript_83434:50-1855(+)